ncbi:glycosyltransferase family 39 protein [Candidatus Curtissbacteria bacterium]|nr:glycosyltransferase family 39 protein [Candidatus Curtissbacteria bacterium]
MKRFLRFLKRNWPIFAVITIGIVLRTVNLERLFYFTYDESIPAFVGRRLIVWHHLPLIGGATPFGFHLAPYFYWLYTVLLATGKLNPLVWGIFSALFAGITIWLSIKIGSELGSKKTAITAGILWAFSELANIYDRHLWALYWGPFFALLTIYSLIKIKQGKKKWSLILAAALALSIHADPSNLVFMGTVFWCFILFKIPDKAKNFLIIGAFTLISISPLIYFDLRHDFANSRPVANFIKQGKNTPGFSQHKFNDNLLIFPRAYSRLVYKFGDNQISKDYSYCKNLIVERNDAVPIYFIIASLLVIGAFFIVSFRKRSPLVFKITSLTLILYFLGIQLYGTILKADIFEHYIAGTFPIFLLMVAYFVSKLPKPVWFVALLIFTCANLNKIEILDSSMGLLQKRLAIEYSMTKVGNQEFSLDSLSTCWKYSGYRYLYIVYGREPVKSYVDPNFAYLYETTPVSQEHPKLVVAMVVHDYLPETDDFYKRYALLKAHEINSKLFGTIEVIIIDNSTGWFY